MAVNRVELHLQALIEEVDKMMAGEKLNTVNILTATLHGMQVAERFPDLKGAEKKELVLRSITELLRRQNVDMNLLLLVPAFIDTSVSLDKGEVHIRVRPPTACCNIL